MSGHGKIVCSCGALIAQCRCFDHHNVEIRQKGCDRCKGLLAPTPGKFKEDIILPPYPAEVDDA